MKELTDGTQELRIPDRFHCDCDEHGAVFFPNIHPHLDEHLVVAGCTLCDRDMGVVTKSELAEWIRECPDYDYTSIAYFKSLYNWRYRGGDQPYPTMSDYINRYYKV